MGMRIDEGFGVQRELISYISETAGYRMIFRFPFRSILLFPCTIAVMRRPSINAWVVRRYESVDVRAATCSRWQNDGVGSNAVYWFCGTIRQLEGGAVAAPVRLSYRHICFPQQTRRYCGKWIFCGLYRISESFHHCVSTDWRSRRNPRAVPRAFFDRSHASRSADSERLHPLRRAGGELRARRSPRKQRVTSVWQMIVSRRNHSRNSLQGAPELRTYVTRVWSTAACRVNLQRYCRLING